MMNDQKKRVLITGATGFLGRYIVQELKQSPEFELTGLRKRDEDAHIGIPVIKCDLADIVLLYDLIKDFDIVIHTAGLISYERGDQHKLMLTNANGTENLINACLEHQIDHFIHISSVAAFPVDYEAGPIKETHRFKDRQFVTEYGLSKYVAESHVWRAFAEGLNVTILNPAIILGAGDWTTGTSGFFSKIYKGLKYFPTGGNGIVYAKDVAGFVRLVMEQQPRKQQFILSAENVSYQFLFTEIAKRLERVPPSVPIKGIYKVLAFAIDRMNKLFFGRYGFLSWQNLKNSSVTKSYDHSLSLTVKGFYYTPILDALDEICHEYMHAVK